MIKKKKLTLVCALATCIAMSGISVSADTASYNWKFNGTSGTLPTGSGYKNDSEQQYYLTISSGNISSSNVFGVRIRRSADDATMSNYTLHYGYKQSIPYSYSRTANTSTLYYMKGKKDSTSTSSNSLSVAGKVTY